MKNGKEAGKDQVNIETLKAGEETIAKQLAKLYTKCITERRIPKHGRKQIIIVILLKKGNRKDIKNYRPICLLSNMDKLFTKIMKTRLEKKSEMKINLENKQDLEASRGLLYDKSHTCHKLT